MTEIIPVLKEFGLPVTFLAITCYAYWQTQKGHKEERKEWREDSNRLHESSNEVLGRTAQALTDLTVAIRVNNEINRERGDR